MNALYVLMIDHWTYQGYSVLGCRIRYNKNFGKTSVTVVKGKEIEKEKAPVYVEKFAGLLPCDGHKATEILACLRENEMVHDRCQLVFGDNASNMKKTTRIAHLHAEKTRHEASDSEGSASSGSEKEQSNADIDDAEDQDRVPGALPFTPGLKFILVFTALGCIGHLLNIIFKDYMGQMSDEKKTKPELKKLKKIVARIRRKASVRRKLREAMWDMDDRPKWLDVGLMIIQAINNTRWWSAGRAFFRLTVILNHIGREKFSDILGISISELEADYIIENCEVFEVFDQALCAVQKANRGMGTCLELILNVGIVIFTVGNERSQEKFEKYFGTVRLVDRVYKFDLKYHEDNDFVMQFHKCSLLTDPDTNQKFYTAPSITRICKDIRSNFDAASHDATPTTPTRTTTQSTPITPVSGIRDLLKLRPVTVQAAPLKKFTAEELAIGKREALGIPACTGGVESDFSATGFLTESRAASMKPKMLEAQMLVRSHRESADLIELVVIKILEGRRVGK